MNALSDQALFLGNAKIVARKKGRTHMSRWPEPLYSKKQVNAAGKMLAVGQFANYNDYVYSLDVINNFRAIHGHPLSV